jgi:type IV secretory pathway TrbF-like protein
MKDGVIEKDVRSFIKALRRVPTDKVLMGEDWDEKEGIYGRVTTKGRKLLTQRVAQHDPMQVKDVVQVEITRTLKKGARSMDVTWTERTYTPEMELKSPPVIYSGIFTWVEQAPRTLAEVYANPLGIWYDEWSFDRQ